MQHLATSIALIILLGFVVTLWECIEYGIKSIVKTIKTKNQ